MQYNGEVRSRIAVVSHVSFLVPLAPLAKMRVRMLLWKQLYLLAISFHTEKERSQRRQKEHKKCFSRHPSPKPASHTTFPTPFSPSPIFLSYPSASVGPDRDPVRARTDGELRLPLTTLRYLRERIFTGQEGFFYLTY